MTRQRVPNAELYRDTARLNLLTNGGFEYWQRGNGPYTADGAYTADGWSLGVSGTLSVSRDSANRDTASTYCLAGTYTHTAASAVQQKLDGYQALLARSITLSIRVRANAANAVRARIIQFGPTVITYSSFHTGGGAYETLTVTVTPAAGSTGITVGVELNASCTFYLDNAMLVVGSVPADFTPMHPADDLARCLRYYEVFGTPAMGDYALVSYGGAGQTPQYPLQWKVGKAVTPTVTKVGTWTVANCSQPATLTPSTLGFILYTTVTALGSFLVSNNTATSCVTAEANP